MHETYEALQKHWIQHHYRWLLATMILVTLFLIGLALHELNIITPFDSFYVQLHSLLGEEKMVAGFRWAGPV